MEQGNNNESLKTKITINLKQEQIICLLKMAIKDYEIATQDKTLENLKKNEIDQMIEQQLYKAIDIIFMSNKLSQPILDKIAEELEKVKKKQE